jgi:hypothetical protein
MIPDYSMDDPQFQGRTHIPEKGIANPRPSNLKMMLRDALPKSH